MVRHVALDAASSALPLGDLDGRTVEYVRLPGGESRVAYCRLSGEGAVAAAERDPGVERAAVVDRVEGRALLRLRWTESAVLTRAAAAVDGRLVGAERRAAGWRLRGRFPDADALAAFERRCRAAGIETARAGVAGETPGGLATLPPAERAVVEAAFEAGYFAVPRETTIAELADSLGLSRRTVSERLRRGLGRFVAATLSEDGGDEPD
jgi:predicted DNA binding protein